MFSLHFRLAVSTVALFSIAVVCPQIRAQPSYYSPPTGFLADVTSPRSLAMGGCVVMTVEPHSPLYNPASLGLIHFDRKFTLSLPSKTDWNFWENMHDVTTVSTVSIGSSRTLRRPDQFGQISVSVGAAYSYLKYSNQSGAGAGQEIYNSSSHNFSAGVGIEMTRAVRLGIGYTIKRVSVNLGPSTELGPEGPEGHSNAYDLGVIAEARVHEFWPHKFYLNRSQSHFAHVELTTTVGYVRANSGHHVAFDASTYDVELPKFTRLGYGMYTALLVNQSSIFSFRLVTETEKDDMYGFRPIPKSGREFGFLGAFYYRTGSFDESNLKTKGYGFSLHGLVSCAETAGLLHRGGWLKNHLLDNLDVTLDYAHLEIGGPIDNTKLLALTLTL